MIIRGEMSMYLYMCAVYVFRQWVPVIQCLIAYVRKCGWTENELSVFLLFVISQSRYCRCFPRRYSCHSRLHQDSPVNNIINNTINFPIGWFRFPLYGTEQHSPFLPYLSKFCYIETALQDACHCFRMQIVVQSKIKSYVLLPTLSLHSLIRYVWT